MPTATNLRHRLLLRRRQQHRQAKLPANPLLLVAQLLAALSFLLLWQLPLQLHATI